MADTDRKPKQPRDFTPSQVAALQPFLPALLRRYREVAATGSSDRPDPICAKVAAGHCYECPIFGAGVGQQPGHWTKPKKGEPKWVDGEEWLHCDGPGFWPPVPPGVTDSTKSVRCGVDPDRARKTRDGLPAMTTRERAQSWGCEMVGRLQGLQAQHEKATQ